MYFETTGLPQASPGHSLYGPVDLSEVRGGRYPGTRWADRDCGKPA